MCLPGCVGLLYVVSHCSCLPSYLCNSKCDNSWCTWLEVLTVFFFFFAKCWHFCCCCSYHNLWDVLLSAGLCWSSVISTALWSTHITDTFTAWTSFIMQTDLLLLLILQTFRFGCMCPPLRPSTTHWHTHTPSVLLWRLSSNKSSYPNLTFFYLMAS